MNADAHRNQDATATTETPHPIRRTTMNRLIISTLAAVIALSSVSTAFAAPKQKVQPQKIPEPIYFTLATGEN
jgi:hypothetical protein